MTLQELIDRIKELGQKYHQDYGITPFDVCLGPVEFSLLWEEGRKECSFENQEPIPHWHFDLAPMFYNGMRIHLLNTPGVWVGALISK